MSDTPLPRDEFPVTERYCYLNHAGVTPLPRSVAQAADEVNQGFVDSGSVVIDDYEQRAEAVRAQAATLMGVTGEDVAFVKNTTEGLGHVASGLDWQPGDRVIVPNGEFPSTIYPWLALESRGVQVDLIEPVGPAGILPLESFAAALDRGPTRLVACSWVQFSTGWRSDLASLATLCHDHGALLCVDVIQGLGVIPAELAAWGVDFAMADSHKWMLGPQGSGVLYVAPEHRERLTLTQPGWNSVVHREEWDNLELVLDPTARRFEGGSLNLAGIMGMGAGFEMLAAAGIDAVWSHVEMLCRATAVRLAEIGVTIVSDRTIDGRSGILTVAVPDVTGEDACLKLAEQDIICSPRGGGVRISPHGYNTDADIDRLVAAISEMVPTDDVVVDEPDPARQGPMRRPRDW